MRVYQFSFIQFYLPKSFAKISSLWGVDIDGALVLFEEMVQLHLLNEIFVRRLNLQNFLSQFFPLKK